MSDFGMLLSRMSYRPRTAAYRRVRTLCFCAWGLFALTAPIYLVSTIEPPWQRGRGGSSGSVGYVREADGTVVLIKAEVSLRDKHWGGSCVGKVAEVKFADDSAPGGYAPTNLLASREDARDQVRLWFVELCGRQQAPDLVALFDRAVANGGGGGSVGVAEVTRPSLYAAAVAYKVLPFWWPLSLLGAAVTTTWLASLSGPRVGGLCIGCGYDLAGLDASAACPECGRMRG